MKPNLPHETAFVIVGAGPAGLKRHTTYLGEWVNFAILPRVTANAERLTRRLIARRLPGQSAFVSEEDRLREDWAAAS